MYISHPIGPRNKIITTQPNRDPIGHLASLGADHGPLLDEIIICAIGKINPTIRNIQATIRLIVKYKSLIRN
jgi:hypothetical protein